jgi:hypothetical protein
LAFPQQKGEPLAKQTSAETEIAQARINRANLGVKAAIAGVQLLEGSRTLSFPKVRILELGSEITDLKDKLKIHENKFRASGSN